MNVTIENDKFVCVINTLGAEIQSLTEKSKGTEYIWNGDASVWKNHAPILFPFIGRCKDNHFMIEGKRCEYTKNHGFVRESETKVILQEKSKVIFELTEGENTLYRFPYCFNLQVEYELVENGLNWKITVKNTDKKPFRFGVGTHAAFACPRNTDPEGTKNSDYVIEFENHEALTGVLCSPDGYLAGSEVTTKTYGEKEQGFVPLTEAGFGNGHLMTNYTSKWVGLRNKKDNSLISIKTEGFPYCMLWQNTAGKPSFVCIEPWHGLPDTEETNHVWEEKIGMRTLNAGESFSCVQDIRIS